MHGIDVIPSPSGEAFGESIFLEQYSFVDQKVRWEMHDVFAALVMFRLRLYERNQKMIGKCAKRWGIILQARSS